MIKNVTWKYSYKYLKPLQRVVIANETILYSSMYTGFEIICLWKSSANGQRYLTKTG